MIFFAILFLALNAACKAKTEFELTDCNEGEDLCFDVENGDEMDTLVLFAQGGNNYKGFMEDSNIQAFASSQDGENFEVRFVDLYVLTAYLKAFVNTCSTHSNVYIFG